jgi:hypothetical protein
VEWCGDALAAKAQDKVYYVTTLGGSKCSDI